MSVRDIGFESAVKEAVEWLEAHPHRDEIDAAYEIATRRYDPRQPRAASLSQSRWPDFLAAVRAEAKS